MNIIQSFLLFFIIVFYFAILTTPESTSKSTGSIFSKLPNFNIKTTLQKQDLLKKVTPKIHFMTKGETKNFLKHDRDKFITGLDELNLTARGVKIPETYIKIRGRYFACVINETSFEVARQKNKNLIMRSVSVTLSNQDAING
jgi:hypothetical protein